MENPATINIKPNAHMYGISSLAHKHTIARSWLLNQFPTLAFRVIPEPSCNSENILGIGNGRKCPTKNPCYPEKLRLNENVRQ